MIRCMFVVVIALLANGFRITFPIPKEIACEDISQIEWTDGNCYNLFDQGPCNEGEEFVVVPSSPHNFGCRAIKCPPNAVPYGTKCELIGEPSRKCSHMFVIRVTALGNGICGCPPYFKFLNDSICFPETEQKTILSFPKECDEGFFLVNNEECVQVTRASLPDGRNIKKRQFLVLSDRNQRLISFLRSRG